MFCLFIVATAALLATIEAVPIDNRVLDDPEIGCGSNQISVVFRLDKEFDGHVFVKGRFSEAGCRTSIQGRATTSIDLPFETCGVNRQRSLNPKGVFVDVTVVITFHPLFITKVDRAYKIQCFYMEADKTVSTELEVSMLTTAFATAQLPMPVCNYQILDGPTGSVIQYALVGDQVYHKWNCVSEQQSDIFCMTVHSCFVDDGKGDKVELITADGCSVDKHLLNNLDYPQDLMAGIEAHVFKYADRPQLYFQCQITITVKEPNAECQRPVCEPAATSRGKRSAISDDADSTLDVRSQGITAMDLGADATGSNSFSPLRSFGFHHRPRSLADRSSGGYCFSPSAFGLLIAMLVLLLAAALTSSAFLLTRRK